MGDNKAIEAFEKWVKAAQMVGEIKVLLRNGWDEEAARKAFIAGFEEGREEERKELLAKCAELADEIRRGGG